MDESTNQRLQILITQILIYADILDEEVWH